MSNARNLSLSNRPDSLSSNSLSSSMESLSSIYTDSYWSMDQQDLLKITQTEAKTSDYETGFSGAEYNEEESHEVAAKVSKTFSLSRTLRPKRKPSVSKENPSEHTGELLSRLAMLEEQVRMMGDQLNKERQQREELEQKVKKLQVENKQLLSERRVAGEQLQNFSKKFFQSINAIPAHLVHSGLSTSSLNNNTTSMRCSEVSINSLTSQYTKAMNTLSH